MHDEYGQIAGRSDSRSFCAVKGDRLPRMNDFDPRHEDNIIVLVEADELREAQCLIEYCDHCRPVDATLPFDRILDLVTISDPLVTHYILETPATCPNCQHEILEKTLVGTAL